MTLPLPWNILAALAVAAGIYAAGDHRGYGRAEDHQSLRVAEAQRQAVLAAEAASRAEARRLALQRERDALAHKLEDAARADPDASRPALSAGSVQRLNQR